MLFQITKKTEFESQKKFFFRKKKFSVFPQVEPAILNPEKFLILTTSNPLKYGGIPLIWRVMTWQYEKKFFLK